MYYILLYLKYYKCIYKLTCRLISAVCDNGSDVALTQAGDLRNSRSLASIARIVAGAGGTAAPLASPLPPAPLPP